MAAKPTSRPGARRGESPRRIWVVVFDLDDVLYLERQYVRSGFAAVAEHVRRHHRAPVGLPGAFPDEPEPMPSKAAMADWMWREFLHGRRQYMFDALSDRFCLALTARQIAALVGVYRRHRPRIHPCRGVGQLLARLRYRGFRLGLLSDGLLPGQELKLTALRLDRSFDAILFTQKLGRRHWKPSPRGFEAIARRLRVPAAACAYIGDNPAKDFVAPNALGWLTIQWRRPGQVHADHAAPPGGQPQKMVRSARELLRILDMVQSSQRKPRPRP